MLTTVYGAKCVGIEAVPVTVEVDIASGIGIHLVGLADAAVKESLLRTVTALRSIGYRIPGKKIVINLAPADMHKKGSGYDLPIAIGIIAASGQEELPLSGNYLIMGELGLDGAVRPVPGAIPMAEMAGQMGLSGCILPAESAMEAVEYGLGDIYAVNSLSDVVSILNAEPGFSPLREGAAALTSLQESALEGGEVGEGSNTAQEEDDILDFADIVGQEGAKRGLEIAAAGSHNTLLIGPPGSGKSSLAKAMVKILPPMSLEEAMQTSKIYSVAGKGRSRQGISRRRPFRCPHYSASTSALIGGGSDNIIPGEISLAHNGVLFLDEFLEIPQRVMEALRGPMEDRKVTISRLRSKIEYPAGFMLIAATNPCPCGYYGEADRCSCTPGKRAAYLSKLSGPLTDRIDVHLWLKTVDARKIVRRPCAESSAAVAERVLRAREIQAKRLAPFGIFTNAAMTGRLIKEFCPLSADCQDFLEKAICQNGLSARACDRILKLARTIADLAGESDIALAHISEAVGYRFLDKSVLL